MDFMVVNRGGLEMKSTQAFYGHGCRSNDLITTGFNIHVRNCVMHSSLHSGYSFVECGCFCCVV